MSEYLTNEIRNIVVLAIKNSTNFDNYLRLPLSKNCIKFSSNYSNIIFNDWEILIFSS